MTEVALSEIICSVSGRAGALSSARVYSVTKHRGFVPSDEYFSKRVFSKDLSTYKVVETGQFAYATIHLDEGSVGYAPETCLVSPMYTVFEVDRSRVDIDYLFRLLKSPRMLRAYSIIGRGSAERRRSISLEALGGVRVPLPTLPEQRRIASILDQPASLTANGVRVRGLTKDFVDSLFADLLKTRPIGAQPLGELASRITDGTHQAPTWATEGVPFLFVSNVVSGVIDYRSEKFVSEETYANLTRTNPIEVGDILYTAVGSYGIAALVEQDRRFIFQRHIAQIKPRGEMVDSRYLQVVLNSAAVKRQADRVARGVAQKTVTLGELSKLLIPVPPMPDQLWFSQRVREVYELMTQTERHGALSSELFASLQHRAFSGQL